MVATRRGFKRELQSLRAVVARAPRRRAPGAGRDPEARAGQRRYTISYNTFCYSPYLPAGYRVKNPFEYGRELTRSSTSPVVLIALALLGGCDGPTSPARRFAPALAGRRNQVTLAFPPANYTIADLGTLPGMKMTIASAISLNGYIAGTASNGGQGMPSHAFVIDRTMHDLGTLPGTNAGQAMGVNKLEHVVGTSGIAGNVTGTQAWFWSPTHGMVRLPTLKGATYSAAAAINDGDQIAGCIRVNGIEHMVTWSGASHTLADLDTGPTHEGACAVAINVHGMMAVLYTRAGQAAIGFYYNGKLTPAPLPWPDATLTTDIGAGGSGFQMPGAGINRYGDIIASASLGYPTSSFFVWTGGGGSVAAASSGHSVWSAAVNINHIAVGEGSDPPTPSGSCYYRFTYQPGAQGYRELPYLVYPPDFDCEHYRVGTFPAAINDQNVIVGAAYTDSLSYAVRAVRWTPK